MGRTIAPHWRVRLPAPLESRAEALDDAVDRAWEPLRRSRAADRAFYSASTVADHSILWLILGALRGLRSEHDWHAAVRVGGAVAAESFLVNVIVKSLFRRERPVSHVPGPFTIRRPRTSSFPSGHASAAFTAATLLAEGDDLAPAYYALATVVSLSRIHVRIHHATDVVAGVALGMALGRLIRHRFPLPTPEGGIAMTGPHDPDALHH